MPGKARVGSWTNEILIHKVKKPCSGSRRGREVGWARSTEDPNLGVGGEDKRQVPESHTGWLERRFRTPMDRPWHVQTCWRDGKHSEVI